MFITASDFQPTTLLKLNSTMGVFSRGFINLIGAVACYNTS